MSAGVEPILSVSDLKTYFYTDEGVVKAVDGVTFDVAHGQTVGVVGESGCGKSVTAFSILRLVEMPGKTIGGRVLLHNPSDGGGDKVLDLVTLPADAPRMRSIRGRDISLIFQEPMTSLSPVHTIGYQMVETIRLHTGAGKREAKQRAIELLRQVGVPRAERRVDAYAYQLSGGLRQRAMIATALSCDPRLLIADEPTTALDVTTQAQILDLLKDLQQARGMAILLITHNLGVIAEMADQVIVMYLGRVMEMGPVDGIFHTARHPYTRALLQSIPSIQSEPRVRLPTIAGSIPHPYNRPPGCPFHPRCPDAMPVCREKEPGLVTVGDGQAASCFLYEGA